MNLSRLNQKQREAAMHFEGPLLILAGAGSGKTSTMTYRIAHLISQRGVKASQILGLSFTNKAALELRKRVKEMVSKTSGRTASHGLMIATFHSLCVKILRQYGTVIGFDANFSILDTNDQEEIVRSILKHIKIDDKKFDPRFILSQFSQVKNKFLSVEATESYFMNLMTVGKMHPDYAVVLASVFPRYSERLKLLNSMDFDDLLYYTARLLHDHLHVRKSLSERFKFILVDEYQDTNPAQFQILSYLTSTHQNLCVVGDDDQSIYGFRGADSTHILEFKEHYPTARLITLDQNYRSTNLILNAANEVISKNTKRFPKTLWSKRGDGYKLTELVLEDDKAEAETIAEKILELVTGENFEYKHIAVLYRSNPQSRIFEEALRMRKIPYHLVGGISFLDRKEIKDFLCYFRLIVNPKDDASFRRVINWPARSIGKTIIEATAKHATENSMSLFESLGILAGHTPAPFKNVIACQNFLKLITDLKASLNETAAYPADVSDWARKALDKIGFKKGLIDEYEDDPAQADKRFENVDELANSIGMLNPDEGETFQESTEILREYLSRLVLENEEEEEDEKELDHSKNKVTLLTLHSSKGLEYPAVFLVGMEEELLPHKRAMEDPNGLSEERRLCYVGMTRAKDRLFVSRTKFRIRYGKQIARMPSRFLKEVPEILIDRQDLSRSPELNTPEAKEKHEVRVKSFLEELRSKIAAPSV